MIVSRSFVELISFRNQYLRVFNEVHHVGHESERCDRVHVEIKFSCIGTDLSNGHRVGRVLCRLKRTMGTSLSLSHAKTRLSTTRPSNVLDLRKSLAGFSPNLARRWGSTPIWAASLTIRSEVGNPAYQISAYRLNGTRITSDIFEVLEESDGTLQASKL